jgi:GAF domain-containing protein
MRTNSVEDEAKTKEQLINELTALRRKNENQIKLSQASRDILRSIFSLEILLSEVIQHAQRLLDTPHILLGLVEPNTHQVETKLELKIGTGIFNQKIDKFEILATTWKTGNIVAFNHSSDNLQKGFADSHQNITLTSIGLPLRSGSEILGVIGATYEDKNGRTFSEDELSLFERFSDFTGLALENAYVAKRQEAELARLLNNT